MLWNKLNSRRSYSFVGMLMLLIARSCVSPGRALMQEIRVCGEYFVGLKSGSLQMRHISSHPSSAFDVRCSVRMKENRSREIFCRCFCRTLIYSSFFNAISASRCTFVFQLIKVALEKKITVLPSPRFHSPPHLSPPYLPCVIPAPWTWY